MLDTAPSLAEALEDTFHRLVDGRLSQTNYVVIICMNRSQEIESCVAVTGMWVINVLLLIIIFFRF